MHRGSAKRHSLKDSQPVRSARPRRSRQGSLRSGYAFSHQQGFGDLIMKGKLFKQMEQFIHPGSPNSSSKKTVVSPIRRLAEQGAATAMTPVSFLSPGLLTTATNKVSKMQYLIIIKQVLLSSHRKSPSNNVVSLMLLTHGQMLIAAMLGVPLLGYLPIHCLYSQDIPELCAFRCNLLYHS
ncbi:unnamed protein product [Gongylonema pulchrum]|uniref:Sideroflexin 3 n=1 Tax=Gongylonema pulchrum TaxID=637853 RepID=A0A183EYW5_9BILA|nr:unnamed protein product [Gongylonema pulchrum]